MFVDTIKHHSREGVEAFELAQKLGYESPRQIGGLTGGGLAKAANRFRIPLKDVYRTEITFPEGKRRVTFYPGKLVVSLLQKEQKPA